MRVTGALFVAALLSLAAVLALWACRREHPAGGQREKKAEGAEWEAEVGLEHLSERGPDYEALRFKIVLRDERGREVETPSVRFQLDGVDLTYRVGRGNYYDRHPCYKLDEESGLRLAGGSFRQLAVSSGGGPFAPFASVPALAPLSPEDFSFPRRHLRDRDLVLSWRNLRQPAELLVYKSLTTRNEQGDVSMEGGPYSDDSLRARIAPGRGSGGEGHYSIPVRYLTAAAPAKVTGITVEITAASSGEFFYPVLDKSHVTTVRKIVFRSEIEDP